MSTPEQVAADIAALPQRLRANIGRAVGRQGLMLQADVQRLVGRDKNEPSLPGVPPRRQIGDYQGSIGTHTTTDGTRISTSVGTNKAQGHRLEHGYDAPGQHTMPHPHFGPALDAAEPRFYAAVRQAIDETTR